MTSLRDHKQDIWSCLEKIEYIQNELCQYHLISLPLTQALWEAVRALENLLDYIQQEIEGEASE